MYNRYIIYKHIIYVCVTGKEKSIILKRFKQTRFSMSEVRLV